MKKYLNNQGYTLIIVLLTIVLITLFAMMLIPKALNTAVQINKSEANTQTKDLSEMGIQYAHALLQSKIQLAINDVKSDPQFTTVNHDKLFCGKITARLNELDFLKSEPTPHFNIMTNTKFSYQIQRNGEMIINSTDNLTCNGFENITVPIRSVGTVEGNTQKEINAQFVIENLGANLTPGGPGNGEGDLQPVDPDTLPLQIINTDVRFTGQTEAILYSSPQFTKDVTVGGNALLSIGGNAWFRAGPNYSATMNGNNGKIIVSGNAYFENPIRFNGAGPHYVCIQGDAFIRNGQSNGWNLYTEVNSNQYCPTDIWEQIEFFYDINDWGIIKENINVTY